MLTESATDISNIIYLKLLLASMQKVEAAFKALCVSQRRGQLKLPLLRECTTLKAEW